MKQLFGLLLFLFAGNLLFAQKKPLDHSVYDSWQSIGEKLVSNDGRYIVYSVNVQEGDGELLVQSPDLKYQFRIPRGYQARITDDSRYLVMKIRPLFRQTRDAKIKKKSPAEMPKDSLGILELGKDSLQKIADVKSYELPERGASWIAMHLYKAHVAPAAALDSTGRLQKLTSMADSLTRVADSIRNKVAEAKLKGLESLKTNKTGSSKGDDKIEEGTDLIVRNLVTGKEYRYTLVSDYLFNKNGQVLVVETTGKNGGKESPLVLWQQLDRERPDTVMTKFNEAKGFAITEDGSRLAFVAERDSATKALKKYYKVWTYSPARDSAVVWAERNSGPITNGLVISPEFKNYFSKDGSRLFFGLSADHPAKDTTLVDFETAKLDIWNYKDDYLQPQQLVQLNNDLRKSWLAEIESSNGRVMQLADDSCELVTPTAEGNARYALGTSSRGYRVQQQWALDGSVRLFVVDLEIGRRRLVAEKARSGSARISPAGNYITWYDSKRRHWMSYDITKSEAREITNGITVPLFDEDDDHPDDPPAHGISGWLENDEAVYVYDKYDIWQCDPSGRLAPVCITGNLGRQYKISLRYSSTNREDKFIRKGQPWLLQMFDHKTKGYGWEVFQPGKAFAFTGEKPEIREAVVSSAIKARDADVLVYNQQTPASNNVFATTLGNATRADAATQLSSINPQQSQYNWFSVELHHWKMFDGKMSEGLLYKPEDFDSSRKYPIILYFYERNADDRYNYIEPMPVRASINIAYYTSNGYLVFDPNIYYKTGRPGEDAYNSVVSAAKYLAKFKWVDSTKMGIQGHSWGGYQVSYLITRTNMFAAAEAGAPVSNMTSAYGGIRWGTGLSRQFQYERTQSRLGATLWEKPELYIKNSPLFRADKVKTPLLILHNDKDDAVPWYQGIEYFTALRRMGKPVWMINYNDELHGIIDRKNRKDWTKRMAQFFDHYLKDAPAPAWMEKGVPATRKGIDFGFGDPAEK